jgi:7-keto-8-aminopelargonate synthetase-like enzyme
MLFRCEIITGFASRLLEEGIYVWLYYPVVPKGEARIRAIVSSSYA